MYKLSSPFNNIPIEKGTKSIITIREKEIAEVGKIEKLPTGLQDTIQLSELRE